MSIPRADTAAETGGDLFLRIRSSVLGLREATPGTEIAFEVMLNGEEERGEMGTVAGICGELLGWGVEPREDEREGMTGAMGCCWCARGLGTRLVSSPWPGGSTSQWSSLDGLVVGREGSRDWRGWAWATTGVAKEAWCADMASWNVDQTRGPGMDEMALASSMMGCVAASTSRPRGVTFAGFALSRPKNFWSFIRGAERTREGPQTSSERANTKKN